MRRRQLTTRVRGREVEIDYELEPADRSVGILSESFSDEVITDATTGERLPWELSAEEVQQISTLVADSVAAEDCDE